MANEEMLRLVDSIHRDKGIDKKLIFESLEQALLSAARRKHPDIEELRVKIDRVKGDIRLLDGDRRIGKMAPSEFGRIAAQTAKQIMIQRIREAERDVVYDAYEQRIGELVNGTVQRVEHGTVVVNLGRTEGIIPRQEQIFNEQYHPGDSIRCYILDVKKKGQKVLIILSRTSPMLVRRLFEQEVPEIYEHTVEIKGLVREAGYRTKIAVSSSDSRVDPVGACVGVRGSRIRNIVDELNGEKIDIVRWNESLEVYIQNALSPAQIDTVLFDIRGAARAKVIVPEDQLSLAIGRKGQNVRLSSRITGMELDVMTIEEHAALRARGRDEIEGLPGVGPGMVNSLLMSGFESYDDVIALGVEALQEVKGIGEKKAQEIYDFSVTGIAERRKREAEEAAAAKAAAAEVEAAAAKAAAEQSIEDALTAPDTETDETDAEVEPEDTDSEAPAEPEAEDAADETPPAPSDEEEAAPAPEETQEPS